MTWMDKMTIIEKYVVLLINQMLENIHFAPD